MVVTSNWANIQTIFIIAKKTVFFRFYHRGVSCAFMDKRQENPRG